MSAAEPRTFIRPRGEDLREGELVMEAGKRLGAADLGMLASLNRSMIDVCRGPRVAIVATGDELVDVDQVPAGAQVVNSSAYALAGAVREAGGEPIILKVARDRPEEIRARLTEAFAFDAVLSTGGVSVGQFDHVKGALDELGMRQIFHGVAQRPGRPLKFGTVGSRPIFGLPGNPVSTMVCFYLYVRPALLQDGRAARPRIAASRGAMRGGYQDGEGPDRVRARALAARGRRALCHADRQPGIGNPELALARRRAADRPVGRDRAQGRRSGDGLGAGGGRGGRASEPFFERPLRQKN